MASNPYHDLVLNPIPTAKPIIAPRIPVSREQFQAHVNSIRTNCPPYLLEYTEIWLQHFTEDMEKRFAEEEQHHLAEQPQNSIESPTLDLPSITCPAPAPASASAAPCSPVIAPSKPPSPPVSELDLGETMCDPDRDRQLIILTVNEARQTRIRILERIQRDILACLVDIEIGMRKTSQ